MPCYDLAFKVVHSKCQVGGERSGTAKDNDNLLRLFKSTTLVTVE